jgi:hypothetical protein
MKVKALKRYFLYTSIDTATIPKDLYKLILKQQKILLSIKT